MKIRENRGIRGLVAAKVKTDIAETFECDTPFSVAGTSNLSKEVETSSSTHYYDNVPAVVIQGNGADTVTIDVSAVDDDIIAKLTGQFYDAELGMLVEGEPSQDYFAIGYITKKTDGTEVFVWRLKGTFSVPGSEHQTEDDGTDATGQQLVFTGINTQHKFTKTNKTAKAVNVSLDTNPLDETEFFSKVQTPDTVTKAAA